MKKMSMIVLVFGALLLQAQAFAGELFAVQAYGPVKPANNGNENYINLVSVSTINCNGTSTKQIRITAFASMNPGGAANAGFLSIAEVVAAAKNGFVIETVGVLSYNASAGGCQVQDYLIRVQ